MKAFVCIRIDNITQINTEQITQENLRLHYGTGINITEKNSQGDKKSKYRIGVQTNLGDIEKSLWIELVEQLIEKQNDQELFKKIFEWEKDNNYIQSKTKKDIYVDALEVYTYRLYDNKKWWDYVRFNMKYRPEILDDPSLMRVHLDCCGRYSNLPKEQVQHNHEAPDTIPCPYCNKGTSFMIKDN